MFITIPKVFASMGLGRWVGFLFFLLVLFAALTSAISLAETSTSTFQDELGWSRRKSTLLVTLLLFGLGTELSGIQLPGLRKDLRNADSGLL